MTKTIPMIANLSVHTSKYGLMNGGSTYEIEEADVSSLEARGYLTRAEGGAKAADAPANKAATPPQNKAEPAPRKKRVTDEGPVLTTGSITTADKGAE